VLLVAACGQAAATAPALPRGSETTQLLDGTAIDTGNQESFFADVALLGLPLASMRSRACPRTTLNPAFQHTEVTPVALVRAFQRSGGHATTELPTAASPTHSSDYLFEEGAIERHYQVTHEAGGYSWLYEQGGKVLRGEFQVPEGAHPQDLHSALGLLRTWRGARGDRGHFYVVMGRRLWRVEVESKGVEMLPGNQGARLTRRIDGEATALWNAPAGQGKRRFGIWFSADKSRVPLRLAADAALGPLTLELTDWSEENKPCAESPTLAAKEQRLRAARAAL
jgi:hypothetical protein